MKKLFGGDNKEVMNFNNPFKQDNITRINFVYRRFNIFGDEVNDFHANIEFKNGNTEGTHKIEASTFSELYQKVMDFCEGI